ncbi:regulation of nucleic acid-templated transcription [Homalodisca vitripennis]|nr:regulation of nucleic acid-templated transcription [Homalodisca vitripennis]
MGYCLQDIVSWYQKKIGTYDKQPWERTVEQHILSGFTPVPKKTAKLKTELIDIDLIRGSSFTKAKPKHGFLTVIRLAVLRLLFLPLQSAWWAQQTSYIVFGALLLLYILQIINMILYFYFSPHQTDGDEIEFGWIILRPWLPPISQVIFSACKNSLQCSFRNMLQENIWKTSS